MINNYTNLYLLLVDLDQEKRKKISFYDDISHFFDNILKSVI